MSSQAFWLPSLVLMLVVFLGALIAFATILRGRVRDRMAGIDRRLDDLHRRTAELEVPVDLVEIEALISRGEAADKLSAQTAAELRDYVEALRREAQEGG